VISLPLRRWSCFQLAHRHTPRHRMRREGSALLCAFASGAGRSMKTLSKLDLRLLHGYTVTETQRADVSGSNGALLNSNESAQRLLEVSVRNGSYNLDNRTRSATAMASGGLARPCDRRLTPEFCAGRFGWRPTSSTGPHRKR